MDYLANHAEITNRVARRFLLGFIQIFCSARLAFRLLQ
jgi:hypothetical protein